MGPETYLIPGRYREKIPAALGSLLHLGGTLLCMFSAKQKLMGLIGSSGHS